MLSVPDFVVKWQRVTLTERSASQEHFLDLCDVLGQETPASADPTGNSYTFERGAGKLSGGDGWADVWKRGCFGWEYKGPHKDLKKAYQQLNDYREDLENPPLLVVSDFNRFEIHTNFTGTVKRVYAFNLTDLAANVPTATCSLQPLEVLRDSFLYPERLRPNQTTAQVTEAAASEFAQVAESLRHRGADPEQSARFLVRLLFCLFAEDIGLLPTSLFTKLVEQTTTRPTEFGQRLRALFSVMATGGAFGADDIPHFNGGLFSDDLVLPLTCDDLTALKRACHLNWADIEPAIFGTLFERSLDPAKRAQLGAHYTSREDILLIVEPVLMAPLRRRWTVVAGQVDVLHGQITALEGRPDSASRMRRTALRAHMERLFRAMGDEIAAVQVLDPACGSGNFLYVGLKSLLDLWKSIGLHAAECGLPGMMPYRVGPWQLHGIEINVYAHELASVVIWIGYIQWLHDNGYGIPATPILQPLHQIVHMDALLAYDEGGRAVEPAWPAADVIVGNPPFLGGNKIRQGLGDEYVDDLFALYAGRVPAFADLVCYWYERARAQIEQKCTKRVGLLATQGIRGGVNRTVLERIKQVGGIFWAQSDRRWILNGATVHVSMVGFDDGTEPSCVLNGLPVAKINADLSAARDLTGAQDLRENHGLAFRGNQKGGAFDIRASLARQMLVAPANPNGLSNSVVVKRWVNAYDLMRRSRDMWLIDFGVRMSEEDAAQFERPFEYVKAHVYPIRKDNNRKAYRERWWIHAEARPSMRKALTGLPRYIVTPHVSKHRVFVWLPGDVLPDHELIVVATESEYVFGVLQSRIHELWARAMGTQLREVESGFRYTPTTTLETFAFPWPPGNEPGDSPLVNAIACAARDLVTKRDAWLNSPDASEAVLKKLTLTNLYNQRPAWLAMAHQRLDIAVLDAYGWPHDLTDEGILERLLALNLEHASETSPGLLSSPSVSKVTARDRIGLVADTADAATSQCKPLVTI